MERERKEMRVKAQEERVELESRNYGMNQLRQMQQAFSVMKRRAEVGHQRLVKDQATKDKMNQRAEELVAQRDALGLDRESFLANLSDEDTRILTKHEKGLIKPRLSNYQVQVALRMVGNGTYWHIAHIVGCSASTAWAILNGKAHANPTNHAEEGRGRPPKLDQNQMFAVARFMFLSKFAQLKDAVQFVDVYFKKKISPSQLSNNLRNVLGFRRKDFINRYPTERNIEETLLKRQIWANRIERDYGETFWWDHISVDEMGLSYIHNSKAWSLVGWVASEWVPDLPVHLTLILAVSPLIGVVYYEIHEGPVTAYIFRRFFGQLLEAAKIKFNRSPRQANFVKIPIIFDNARIHHSEKLDELLKPKDNAELFLVEPLPVYSPMLNIVEEVNRDIKLGIWRMNTRPGGELGISMMAAKITLIEELQKVEVSQLHKYVAHVMLFLEDAKKQGIQFIKKRCMRNLILETISYFALSFLRKWRLK